MLELLAVEAPVVARERAAAFERCPLCPEVDAELVSRYGERHADLRRHLVEDHASEQIADALVVARSELAAMSVACSARVARAVEAAQRIAVAELASAESPLSKSIIDRWPGSEATTGQVADLVGEKEARTLVALRRLCAQRVIVKVGVGRWRMR